MANSEKKERNLDDPKITRLYDYYTDKYAEKEAHEEVDDTFVTRLLYLVMHATIIVGTVSGIQFLHMSRLESTVMMALATVGCGILEWLKGANMEAFFNAKLKSEDIKQPKEIRAANEKRQEKKFLVLAVFWVISIGAFCASGVFVARDKFGTGPVLVYDTTIENSVTAATDALNKATTEGRGSATLRDLSAKVETARKSWENHKKEADALYAADKAAHDDDLFTYGLIAFIICIILEGLLFAARAYHEKRQYVIAQSITALVENTDNKAVNRDNKSANTDNSDKYKAEIKDMKEDISKLNVRLIQLQTENIKLSGANAAMEKLLQNQVK